MAFVPRGTPIWPEPDELKMKSQYNVAFCSWIGVPRGTNLLGISASLESAHPCAITCSEAETTLNPLVALADAIGGITMNPRRVNQLPARQLSIAIDLSLWLRPGDCRAQFHIRYSPAKLGVPHDPYETLNLVKAACIHLTKVPFAPEPISAPGL